MADAGLSSSEDNLSNIPVQQQILIVFLLIFYCMPDLIILIASIWSILKSPSGSIESNSPVCVIVSELGTHSGIYTNTIHQMILPVIAGITAASKRKIPLVGWSSWIFILPLSTIFICITDALLFNVMASLEESKSNSISQYFISNASNLSVYVMLLVGLKAKE